MKSKLSNELYLKKTCQEKKSYGPWQMGYFPGYFSVKLGHVRRPVLIGPLPMRTSVTLHNQHLTVVNVTEAYKFLF